MAESKSEFKDFSEFETFLRHDMGCSDDDAVRLLSAEELESLADTEERISELLVKLKMLKIEITERDNRERLHQELKSDQDILLPFEREILTHGTAEEISQYVRAGLDTCRAGSARRDLLKIVRQRRKKRSRRIGGIRKLT